MSSGAELIAAERQRQVDAEGWTPEHDLRHDRGEMVWAAVCYAAPETVYVVAQDGPHQRLYVEPWPQSHGYMRGEATMLPWRRTEGDRIAQLVKAGALMAAEIDRLASLGGEGEGEDRGG